MRNYFWFDKGYSAYTLCKAMGGSHYDMMGEKKTLALYPLADIDQPAELNWACGYIEDCLESTGFKVNSYHRAALRSGLIRFKPHSITNFYRAAKCYSRY